jgi:hypothetical protein
MKMKINQKLIGVTSVALLVGMCMAPFSCDAQGRGRGQGHGQGKGGSQQIGLSSVISQLPMQDISDVEKAGLVLMREEEKLARDVYRTLYKKWKHLTFAQIAKSEQQHMDTLKIVLDKYNLADPILTSESGVFANPELQELYASLIEKGERSLVDALQVGATIEDLDIKDLYELIEQTDNKDIKIVYQNLAKGSRNHMRAFTARLAMNNSSYKAQFLTSTVLADIVKSSRERGMVDENGLVINRRSGSGKGKRGSVSQGGGRVLTSK